MKGTRIQLHAGLELFDDAGEAVTWDPESDIDAAVLTNLKHKLIDAANAQGFLIDIQLQVLDMRVP